jgi:hypothetical protein
VKPTGANEGVTVGASSERDRQPRGDDASAVKDRRRAVQRAIRERQEPPAGLEDVAMQVALRQSGLRWFVVLYAVGFGLEVLGVVVATSAGIRLRDAVLALLFLGAGYLQWRTGQRARDAVERWSPAYEQRRRSRKRSGGA